MVDIGERSRGCPGRNPRVEVAVMRSEDLVHHGVLLAVAGEENTFLPLAK